MHLFSAVAAREHSIVERVTINALVDNIKHSQFRNAKVDDYISLCFITQFMVAPYPHSKHRTRIPI